VTVCPSCGKENPEGFTFCGYCTAPLAEQPTPVVEERKVVSVLFCDLVGFTAASEQQDPEDVRARIRPYHARLRQEIERYGGTVEKFVGDAVMAVCGAPVAHEDDAERAVRAGLRILEAIAELNEADPELGLQVRIGINTGEAVVAVGARPERGEGLVTGDVVNTAARIQTVAPVNGVAVSQPTYRTTSHVFEYEPLAPVSVKGKAEPLSLWRANAVRDRFGRDSNRGYDTPFVGRELEKPLLIGTFERAAQQRSVQLVTIVGEPGVGKSRLAAELFAYIDAKPELITWRQGRCLPYGEGITFWALGEIVKAEAGILESDSAEVAAAKLEAAVSPEEPERQWLLQRLAPLVGVEAASPAERQELFTAWRRFLEGLAAARTSVLVFDDLHWADEALLAFLEYLAEWSQGVPLLVLCTARPELYERRPGWGAGQRNAHTINLSPLSDRETAELIFNLTIATVLSKELESAILERAGGNPLYAEEFVRLLADRGLEPRGESLDASELPESVQALIAARLDTLSPERKSLLQDAAVLGKVFWLGALAEIGGRDPGEVELALHDLARKELVRPARTSSMEGESEYSFWHLLVRDVAYSQIPRAERTRRHRAAAAWIERRAGARVEDLAEVLSHHYLQALQLAEAAGDSEQVAELAPSARRFLTLAGERALGLDTAQAQARLARALELMPSEDPGRPDLLAGGQTPSSRLGGRARQPRRSTRRSLRCASGVTPRPQRGRCSCARASRNVSAKADRSRWPPKRSSCSSSRTPGRRSSPPTRSSRTRNTSAAPTPRRSPPQTARWRWPWCSANRSRRAHLVTAVSRVCTPKVAPDSPRCSTLWSCSSNEEPAATPQFCRTTSASPATRSRDRPPRSLHSKRGSISASSAGSVSRLRSSSPTVQACWRSSAGRKKRSNEPAGLRPCSKRGARRRARRPPRAWRARGTRRHRVGC
jgi:class 3 adenylate cyclase